MVTPADAKAILVLHEDGVESREISARLCLPVLEVRKVIAQNGSASAKDMRIEAIIVDALASHRQRTRNLGERLKVAMDECLAAVLAERAEKAEKERRAAEKAKLRKRADQLQAELNEVRARLRGSRKATQEGEAA